MQHEWLIDVLADLKTFAKAKGMGASVVALDDAALVVLAELTSMSRSEKAGTGIGEHEGQTGSVTYLFAERGRA